MIRDLTVDSYIAHDFDELYELLLNAEPGFQRKNMWYEILQCGDEENWNKCRIIAQDLTKSYKKPESNDDFFSSEFYEDIQFFDSPYELVHKYKLKEGKTIAQIICDNNGWDYSILPVYPKWYSPLLGDIKDTDDDGK